MNLKAIIFDLDDTLYPQKSFKESGFKSVCSMLADRFDYDFHANLEILNQIIVQYGPSYPFIFNKFIELAEIEDIGLEDYIQNFINHEPDISCFPGTLEILAEVKKHFRLGLLTDGRHGVQRRKVAALGIASYFDNIYYSDEYRLSKPSPELYALIERDFSMNSNNLVYVGDNPNKDFVTAKNRGWTTIRVLTGEYAKSHFPAEFEAHFAIDNLRQLPQFINRLVHTS